MHENAHNGTLTEKRGPLLITRGMEVFSSSLGISGKCDVLEFHACDDGVSLNGWEGRWQPFPVEYKRGEPKKNNCDAAQLCAQAMCLEEMLCCDIPCGALFYGEIRRRSPVVFTAELRDEVRQALAEMHELYQRGYTPKVRPTKACRNCSLKDFCLPALMNEKQNVKVYMSQHMEDRI